MLPDVLRTAPHRPVLAPAPQRRLIGLDPLAALAVEGLSPPLAALLDELVVPTPHRVLRDRAVARGAAAEDVDALLHDLIAAGAVVDAAGPARRARHRAGCTVVVVGDGPLAVGVAVGLAGGGVGAVHSETAGTVGTADLGTGLTDADLGRPRSAAVRSAVRRAAPGVRAGPPPRRLVADLVVLADALVVEPGRTAGLHAAGTAHLPVVLRDGVGVVGPLVLPGRTSCTGCVQLRRAAADGTWELLPALLLGRTGTAEPAAVAATAALAAAQVLAALDGVAGGGEPPALEATLALDVVRGALVRQEWRPAATCGCGAFGADGGTAGEARQGGRTSGGARHGPATRARPGDRGTIRA